MLNFTVLGHHCNPSWNLSFTISPLIKLEPHVFSECGSVAHSTFKVCCSFSQTEEMLQICKHIQPSRSVAPLLLKMKCWSYPPPHEHYSLYWFSVCCFSSVQILPLRKNQKKKKKIQKCCSYQLLLITYLFQIWRWRRVSSILLLLHMSICTDFRFFFSLSPVHIFLLLRTKQKLFRKWWWRRKTDGKRRRRKRRRREKRKNASKMLLLPMQTRSLLFSLDEMLFCFQVLPRDAADEA